jgi:hypothetical protein
MTEQTEQIPQATINSTATPTLTINCQDAEIHLAILGDRQNYWTFQKNFTTEQSQVRVYQKNQVLDAAQQANLSGYSFWISLNPKTGDGNINVTHIADYWIEIDARPSGVTDRPATTQELATAKEQTETLKTHFERAYGAKCFIAYSGNGYHLHFPLTVTELIESQRLNVNTKICQFTEQIVNTTGVKVDTCTDLNRKTALIGSYNVKLPSHPLKTYWLPDCLPSDVFGAINYSRTQNQKLLDTILATSIEQQQTTKRDITKPHLKLEEILKQDQKLNDLYNGNWKQYGYPTRSEAEAAVLTILFGRYGFSTDEAREAMKSCKIGKWQERPGSYRETTLQHALKWITEHPTETEYEEDTKPRESQADRLYKVFITKNCTLFHDQYGAEYARIPLTIDATDAHDALFTTLPFEPKRNIYTHVTDEQGTTYKNSVSSVSSVKGYETVSLKHKKFKQYLARIFYDSEEKVLSSEAISQVSLLLQADAAKGKLYELFNRVALDPNNDGSIWFDIADNQNHAYHITKDGWTIESEVPILFQHQEHQKPLAIAVKGGDAWKLLKYIKIATNKDNAITKRRQLLFMVQSASYIIPDISHYVNAMFGCPGSYKSSAQRYTRMTFDPSSVPLLGIPRDENAALQVIDHHYMPIFDNLRTIPDWLSDILCRAVTGAGQEKRALYTDDEPIIRFFRRCIMLNGVNLPTTQGDLLNRTILHPTEPSIDRRTEQDLNTEFSNDLPVILGGFLDSVAIALKIKSSMKPSKLFRLADFTEWGAVLAIALGSSSEEFIIAMDENLESQNTADIENNPVADAFLAYCETLSKESTTEENPDVNQPSYVFTMVTAKAREMEINTKSKRWPTATCHFTKKLNNSKNAIMAFGWNFDIIPRGAKRDMSIWRIVTPVSIVPSTPESLTERLKATYDFIKQKHRELGPFKIELVKDKEMLKLLMCDGKVFETCSGYIAPTAV